MAARGEQVPSTHVVDDPVVTVKQLVADLEAREDVLQAQAVWSSDAHVTVVVVVAEFSWESREAVIAMIDDVHRRHVDAVSVEFDIVDRDHRPYAEFL